MELKEALSGLTKRWVTILVCLVLGGLLAFGHAKSTTPEYQSKTQLYVSVRPSADSTGELAQGASYSRQVVNTYVDIIPTGIVLQPVIDQLGLSQGVSELASQLTVTSPSETALIDIVARDQSPDNAARIAEAVGQSFKNVVAQQLEPSTSRSSGRVNLTTTQEALVPTAPFRPNVMQNTLLGLLLGLVLGVGLAYLRNIFDTRIHNSSEAMAATGLPLIGGIVEDPNASKVPLTMRDDAHSPRAESYRSLRTNLQFLSLNSSSSTYVITSANPGEGKSTTSLNLALALAESGSRVALVEADLRLPTLHKHLNVDSGVGLTDVLVGRVDLDDVLEPWGDNGLYFLPAGRIPPNPSELLGSSKMGDVISKMRSEFDTIIIDAPPILSVTDAAVVGHGDSLYLLVVAAGSTRKQEVGAALEALGQANASVAGLVVTRLPQKSAGRYGYGNYGASHA